MSKLLQSILRGLTGRGLGSSMVRVASLLALAFAPACSNGEDVERPSASAGDASVDADAGAGTEKEPGHYFIGGEVEGLTGSVSLQLADEQLQLTKNGAFRFDSTLSDGAAYSVEVAAQPDDEFCVVSRGSGKIAGKDVENVRVVCEPGNPGITGIELSTGELSPGFSPEVTRYRVDVPLWVEHLTLEPALADSDVDVTIGDSEYHGQPLPFDLMLGQNTLEVRAVSEMGEQRRYTLDIHRAMRVVEDAYGKATVPAKTATLGFSAALDRSRTALGAPGHPSAAQGLNGDEANEDALASGAAYVFERGETGWRQEAFIKASNAAPDDLFGYAVSLVGDLLAVGAPEEDSDATGVDGDAANDAMPGCGAVYLFEFDGKRWTEVAYLKPSQPAVAANFGHSVAIQRDGALAGKRIVVGAYHDPSSAVGVNPAKHDDAAPSSGAVYVFELRDGGWQQTAMLKASNTDPGDSFGASVDISRNTLVVGAIGEQSAATGMDGDQTSDEGFFSGAAYLFEYDEDGDAWAQIHYLKASNSAKRYWFGNAVSIDDDTLAVAAFAELSSSSGIDGEQDDQSAEEAGAVYIFDRDEEGAWSQTAYLKASNSEAGDRFGGSLVLRDNALAVGAPLEDSKQAGVDASQNDNEALGAGAVYVFFRNDGVWSQQVYVKPSQPDPGDNFGDSIGFDGVTLAVGTPYEDSALGGVADKGGPNNAAVASGAVYWFR